MTCAKLKPRCEPIVIEREALLILALKAAAHDQRKHGAMNSFAQKLADQIEQANECNAPITVK